MTATNEELLQSRRKFIRNMAGMAAGAALLTVVNPVIGAVAEEAPKQEDYKWIPSAPPCKLIEETTAADAPADTRSFKFTTDGRTCSKSVTFDIVGTEQILKNVVYDGGCNGGTQGIAAMAEGRPAKEVISCLLPIVCELKKSGSSCPQQLAMGMQQALMIVDGTPCPGCSGTTCVNVPNT